MSALYKALPEVEALRLGQFGYPHVVSAGILDKLDFVSLLDAGCGTSPALAHYVLSRNGGYTGIDSGKVKSGETIADRLNEQFDGSGAAVVAYEGDIRSLQLGVQYDITHTRFVLMHAPGNQRSALIDRVLSVTKKTAVFLEYDWTPMLTATAPEVLVEFVGTASIFAGLTGMNLQMGRSLPNHFVGCEFGTEVVRFSRPKADYTSELIQLCEVMRAVCLANAWALPANRARLVQESLEHQPIEFVPADIVAVIVRK